jgi:hypothetical protein
MAVTYDLIGSTTLSGSAATITFSSLGTYTDLIIMYRFIPDTGSNAYVTYNGDTTGSNYYSTYQYNTNGTPVADRTTFPYLSYANATVGNGAGSLEIYNYRNTTVFKTSENIYVKPGIAANYSNAMWKNTSAITSIEFRITGTTFATGSTFSVYGITEA